MPEVAERTAAVDYHRDYSAVSRSMLSTLKESPRLYYELYVSKTMQPPAPTEAMVRGTRFDVLLLEPARYRERYAVAPLYAPDGKPWDRRFKEHKAAWESWRQSHADKEPVTISEHSELLLMVRGALRHSEIDRAASAPGNIQARLDWIDPTFGIKCKALADKVFIGSNLIVDVKTAEDPSPEAFQRAVVRYGYHRQQAWYSTGWRIEFDETPRFLFCVVGSKPPYDAAVYELDSEAVNAGHTENEFLLRRLVELQSSGDWCPSWGKGVVTLGLPRWHDPYKSEVYE